MTMSSCRLFFYLNLLWLILASGCAPTPTDRPGIPPDFLFVMDARSAAGSPTDCLSVQVNAAGEGRYDRYDSGGVIQGDIDDWVTYRANQIIESRTFQLTLVEVVWLWAEVNRDNFF
jgi:hypothetical protein